MLKLIKLLTFRNFILLTSLLLYNWCYFVTIMNISFTTFLYLKKHTVSDTTTHSSYKHALLLDVGTKYKNYRHSFSKSNPRLAWKCGVRVLRARNEGSRGGGSSINEPTPYVWSEQKKKKHNNLSHRIYNTAVMLPNHFLKRLFKA